MRACVNGRVGYLLSSVHTRCGDCCVRVGWWRRDQAAQKVLRVCETESVRPGVSAIQQRKRTRARVSLTNSDCKRQMTRTHIHLTYLTCDTRRDRALAPNSTTARPLNVLYRPRPARRPQSPRQSPSRPPAAACRMVVLCRIECRHMRVRCRSASRRQAR